MVDDSEELITVVLTRAEAGDIMAAIRQVHRKKLKFANKREDFDPVIGAGLLRAIARQESIIRKIKKAQAVGQ